AEILHDLLDGVEVVIHLNLLRRVVVELYHPAVNVRLKVDPDTFGVPEHLGHLFVQREHETRLTETRAFGDVLERHHALAHTGDPGHDRRTAEEVPPIHDLGSTTVVRSEEQRLNSSHDQISYAVFCLKKKKNNKLP